MPSIPQLRDKEPQSITRHSDGDAKYTPFTVVKGMKAYVPEPGGEENDSEAPIIGPAAKPGKSGTQGLSSTPGTQEAEDKLQATFTAPGTQEAKGVRDKVQGVTEGEEVLTFDDALEAYSDIKKGDYGWHCIAHKRTKLTPEQSQKLATLINDKIDPAKMKEEAEVRKAKKVEKNARKKAAQKEEKAEEATQKEAAQKITDADILAAIPQTKNRKEAGNLLAYCEKTGKNTTERDEERDVMVVLPIDGAEGSEERAKAFNEQFDAFAEEDRERAIKRKERAARAKEKVLEGHVKWAVGKMEEAKSTPHLENIIQRDLGHMIVIKEGRGKYDWTVQLKKGKPETYKKVIEEAMRIKKEVGEKARKKAEIEKAREGIEGLMRRVRR